MPAKTVSITIPIEEIPVKNKEALENLVIKEIEKIENGLSTIGCKIPIDDDLGVDILCTDFNGQIIVFKLNLSEDDNSLFEGLHILH